LEFTDANAANHLWRFDRTLLRQLATVPALACVLDYGDGVGEVTALASPPPSSRTQVSIGPPIFSAALRLNKE
jgi:hypothetical protein